MAFSPQPFATTAADLKFLHSEAQSRIGNVKSGSGAGIVGWPEPALFEIREGWML
jgi:hypothetical protein